MSILNLIVTAFWRTNYKLRLVSEIINSTGDDKIPTLTFVHAKLARSV